MDERQFLDRIRKMKENGQKIGLTEMKTIEEDKKKIISEWEDAGVSDVQLLAEETIDLDELDNVDVQNLDPDEQREEENNFKDTVSKLVKFEKVKVHRENVEWSGHLIREKIDWVFSLDDTIGCYIDTTDFTQLRDETLETLKKLRGYYDVWSDEWSGRLTGTPSSEEPEMEMPGEDIGMETPGGEEFGAEGGQEGGNEGGGFGALEF